jgi:SAM-dependent methyltransferase
MTSMPAAPSLSARIKRVLPQPVKSALKDVLGTVDPLLVQMYRLGSPNGAPIPPRHLRARVGSSGIGRFREAGERCTASIVLGCAKLGRDLSSFERVLDFGCGSGRTIQFTGRQVKAIYGCDVDSEAIVCMQQAYGGGQFLTNKYDPPLPFEPGFFDLVFDLHAPAREETVAVVARDPARAEAGRGRALIRSG